MALLAKAKIASARGSGGSAGETIASAGINAALAAATSGGGSKHKIASGGVSGGMAAKARKLKAAYSRPIAAIKGERRKLAA